MYQGRKVGFFRPSVVRVESEQERGVRFASRRRVPTATTRGQKAHLVLGAHHIFCNASTVFRVYYIAPSGGFRKSLIFSPLYQSTKTSGVFSYRSPISIFPVRKCPPIVRTYISIAGSARLDIVDRAFTFHAYIHICASTEESLCALFCRRALKMKI